MNIMRKTTLSLFIFPTLFKGIISSWDHSWSPLLLPSHIQRGYLSHSRAFSTKDHSQSFFFFFFFFFSLLPLLKGLLSYSRVILQLSILSFFFLFPPSFKGIITPFKGLLPYSRAILWKTVLSLFFYFFPYSKGLSMMMCVFFFSSLFYVLLLGFLFESSLWSWTSTVILVSLRLWQFVYLFLYIITVARTHFFTFAAICILVSLHLYFLW